MKLLVTGGREFRDRELLDRTLDKALKWEDPVTILIHGNARGADRLAKQWALRNGVQPVDCDANWDFYKNSAGPRRNAAMLLLEPDLVIAFPGGTGTANMVKLAKAKLIPVVEVI